MYLTASEGLSLCLYALFAAFDQAFDCPVPTRRHTNTHTHRQAAATHRLREQATNVGGIPDQFPQQHTHSYTRTGKRQSPIGSEQANAGGIPGQFNPQQQDPSNQQPPPVARILHIPYDEEKFELSYQGSVQVRCAACCVVCLCVCVCVYSLHALATAVQS